MAQLIRGLDARRVADNLARARAEIGRDDVQILAAVKYVAAEEMGVLTEAGVTLVGENRAQELEIKAPPHPELVWDFIGHVQSRKVKLILPHVRWIHSVASDSVLKELGKTYHICPTYNGGRDWPQGAYNPKTNVMYMPLSNLCIESTARTDRPSAPSNVYNTNNVGRFAAGKDKVGRIDAISVETGKTLWSWETRVTNYSPILATGGGLLFNGSMDRYLRALDADKGQVLWQSRLPSQVVGGAVAFSINRRQYIAVAAGGGPVAAIGVSMTPEADTLGGGNAVYVFALPQ